MWGLIEVLYDVPAVNACTVMYLWQVNQENVVKVGHRQVVNMIRQGGNRLLIKVVTVSRNLDPEDTARKKGTNPCRWFCSVLRQLKPVSWYLQNLSETAVKMTINMHNHTVRDI